MSYFIGFLIFVATFAAIDPAFAVDNPTPIDEAANQLLSIFFGIIIFFSAMGIMLFEKVTRSTFITGLPRYTIHNWANLEKAYLSNTILKGASMRRANLSFAYLDGADIENANIQDVDSIEGADFHDAKMGNTLVSRKHLPNDKGEPEAYKTDEDASKGNRSET